MLASQTFLDYLKEDKCRVVGAPVVCLVPPRGTLEEEPTPCPLTILPELSPGRRGAKKLIEESPEES